MKKHWAPFLMLVAAVHASGCLTIQKKSMVVLVPPESKEVHIYYVFEGISVVQGKDASPKAIKGNLERARNELDRLKKPDFSFYIPGLGSDENLAKYCKFESVRFFQNQERERKLCMDRRVTITDRDAFVRELNDGISAKLRELFKEQSPEELLSEIKKANEPEALVKARESIDGLGLGPFAKTVMGLVTLANDFDLESLKKFNAAANAEGERWLRFEADRITVHLPATADRARKIAASKNANVWLKDMRDFVTPIDLTADKNGLVVILGKEGEPIRFTHEDRRPYRKEDESALFEHVGAPKAIIIDGKAADGNTLIQRFLAEKKKK